MQTTNKLTEVKDRSVILSTLWVFAMFNYLYADVFGLYFNPVLQKEVTRELQQGSLGGMQITEGFVLGFAILMETAIAMVLLSRVLSYGANRWANIIVGVIHTAAVSLSLATATPSLFYAFFAAAEIACTLFIVGYAWTWAHVKDEAFTRRESSW
jgi:hypothetical protein